MSVDPTEMSRRELIRYTLGMMRRHGIRPKRRLGQNFVVDPRLIKDMIEHASLSKEEVVLEVGAGIGTLTLALAKRCKRVIAVEVDRHLEPALREVANLTGNVEVIIADVMEIELPRVDKVISNIPYSISSPFTEKLLREVDFKLAILTYQLEFARRLYASPGSKEYSRLTVLAYYYAEVQPIRLVPPLAFLPRPKVFSEIVKILPRAEKPFALEDEKFFFDLVRELFSQRRKAMRNALRIALRNLGMSERAAEKTIERMPDITSKRVEELSPEELGEIANYVYRLMNSSEGK